MSDTTRAALARKLDDDRAALARAGNYYDGHQPLRFIDPDIRRQLGSRLVEAVINWPRLIVDSIEERLDVVGFRLGADLPTDAELWRLWQANGLDEASQLAHLDALVYGRSFVMVGPGADPATPRISVESPLQVCVVRDDAGGILAALKRWKADDGHAMETVMTRDSVATWRSPRPLADYGNGVPAKAWQLVDAVANQLGVVPVVGLVNRPRAGQPDGVSELTDVMPLADAINKLASDVIVAAEYYAAPRRWITGLAPSMATPTTEQARDLADSVHAAFETSRASKLWIAPSPETKFGSFPEAELTGLIGAVDMFVKALSAIAALPPHYVGLAADANPASAEAIRSAEASLVTRARRRQRVWGGSWEDVMRLALQVRDGRAPVGLDGLETVWANPETRTVAQAADAAVKLFAAGIIDRRAALEDLGYSPAQVDRMTGGGAIA